MIDLEQFYEAVEEGQNAVLAVFMFVVLFPAWFPCWLIGKVIQAARAAGWMR